MSTRQSDSVDPIRIHVGRQGDGCTYALNPRSRRRIEAAFPGARVASHVYVGFDGRGDQEDVQESIQDQVAMLLTGLSREQLLSMGGVEVYDPDTQTSHAITALAS